MKRLITFLMALMLTWIGASAQYVDYSSKMSVATTDWSVSGTNLTTTTAGSFRTGVEYYNDTATNFSGLDMSQTITGLPAGTYTVSFFAAVNEANNSSNNQSGTEFRAYVQDATVEGNYVTGTVGTLSAAGISWGEGDFATPYTFTVTLTEGQSLKYGISNTGGGGNWAVIQPVSLIHSVDAQTEGDVVHDCLVIMGPYNSTSDRCWPLNWSSSSSTTAVGNFHVNTWSTEGSTDGTGMTTPFIEYWFGSGTNVADAVLSHETLTGLTPGLYEVSVLARAYNEGSSTAVGQGITFNANSASVDLTTGTVTSGTTPAMAYGTYTVIAEVTEEGTLDINFTIQSETSCDWLAWKDLKVVYDGESLPDLEIVTGDMNADVQAAMQAAVEAYNTSKSTDDYTVALAAIEAAEESVAQYAEVAALVTALDDAGKAVWEETESGIAYAAKSLTITDDITDDMVAAQKAQTSANTDWSYVLKNTGTWVNAISATNNQQCPSLPTAHEVWSADAWSLPDGFTAADAIYKRIEELPAGEYTISFYAYGSEAANVSRPLAFANNSTQTEVAYASALVWNESSLYTFNCTVNVSGELNFGMKTQGNGNWYVMEGNNLTLVSLAAEATDTESDYKEGDTATVDGTEYTIKSDNMVENHSFELGFTGWTNAEDHTTEITVSNFDLRSNAQDGNVCLVGTTNGGSSAASSICKVWEMEAGKTYYLSYYVKGLTDNTSGTYLMTAVTNTVGNDYDIDNSKDADDAHLLHNFSGETIGNEWQKAEIVFTNGAEDAEDYYTYLQVHFRWLNSQWAFDNFQLYEVEEAETIEWEMTDAGWGTLILPFAADVPEGLTAYSCASLEEDNETLSLTEETALASCTPYIVKGTADTYTFTGTPENEKDKYQVGLLVGTLADMSLDDGDFSTAGTEYVLQNHTEDGEGLAFYPITSASEGVTLEAYHCYLNTGAAVTALRLPGMATGIVAVEGAEAEANGAIYDLSGRRVAKAVKGVYIQNGKKVLVK